MEVKSGSLCPRGYKQTEVGVIPEGWEVRALESVARIIDPQPDHRTPPETAGGEPYIGISDFIDDETVDWDSSRKIVSRAVDKQQLSFQVSPGNIIFGKIGTIGSPKFLPTVPFRFGLSANVLLIQPRIEPNFVMAWLRSNPCQRAVNGELHSTSQAAFGINKMRRIMIPLPPEAEQRAIATALSDVDGLLGGLDRLITKKRDLKQAAMQQLLTGQTRLPGFHGEWEVKRIGESIELLTGFPFPSAEYCDVGVRLLRGSNVKRGVTDWSDDLLQCWPRMTPDISRYELRVGDLVIAMDGSLVGRSYARLQTQDLPAVLLQRVARIRSAKLDIGYLTQFVGSDIFISYCDSVKTVTAIPHISPSDIRNFTIPIPSDMAEQTAIAEVLTEMDAELAALTQRRDKTRTLKQAMMQELLTGRTRLVAHGDAENAEK